MFWRNAFYFSTNNSSGEFNFGLAADVARVGGSIIYSIINIATDYHAAGDTAGANGGGRTEMAK